MLLQQRCYTMSRVQQIGFIFLSTGIGMVMYGLITEGLIIGVIGGALLWAKKADSQDGR